MASPHPRPPLHRLVQGIASTAAGSWLFARLAHRLDGPILRLTAGRVSLTSLLAGLPIVTLTTTGAKSGKPRSVPLVGLPDGDQIILIASNFGQTHYPAWYHNLRAYPEATLTINGQTGRYVAEEVTGEEREAYWRQAVALYPGYAAYRRRVGARHIPVVRLMPVQSCQDFITSDSKTT